MSKARSAAGGIALLALCACASGTPHLMHLRNPEPGPDEFSILPPKALTLPQDVRDLPPPTPGGTNLTDPTPEADAIVALGGKPGGGAGGNAALVNYAGRYGTDPTIRSELDARDLQFRKNNRGRILERVFNASSYFRVYGRQSLDKEAELNRWRARGVRTPSAPPPSR